MSSFQIYIIKRNNNSPRDIKELSEWVSNQIESTPVECQDDRRILCTPLRDCYEQILERYPALNGRDATDDDELIDKAFDYYLSRNVIMIDCTYSQHIPAFEYVQGIAKKYGLCIYHTQSIKLLDDNNTPIGYATRHYTTDYPTLWKAIILSLKTPIIVSMIIFAVYYIIKYLCTLNPLPDYLPSIHISPTTIAVITFIYAAFLIVIGVRNARRGRRKMYEETNIDN